MRKSVTILLVCLGVVAGFAADKRPSDEVVEMTTPLDSHPAVELPDPVYRVRMSATYDTETKQIEGVERLRWRNTSSAPVSELQFHMYLNAFANNRSTFMTESGGQLRGVQMSKRRWGWIDVKSMRLAYGNEILTDDSTTSVFPQWMPGDPEATHLEGRPDLKDVEEFIQPDDGNENDRTVARYPLPRAIEPGAWVELEIAFTSQMPEIFARTGAQGDYVLAGQWFPKIGVFEDVGVRGREEPGWNTHQFHANSEFYADFGDWDVELTLPVRYAGRIGATGELVEERTEGDSVVARFVQPGVHDFAWTADADYIVIDDRFDPVADVPAEQLAKIAETLGLTTDELMLQPVEIRLMLQPAHRSQADRYIGALKAALRGYGLRLGAYPWKTMTMVDPPRGGFGSAGMEYPTLITLGTHPLLQLPGFTGVRMPEMVTLHELGHNFFQGMIANNEFEEAWIDEGMNSYYEMVVMEEAYGTSMEAFGARLLPEDSNRRKLRGGGFTDAIVQPSWSYRTGSSYGLNSYARPAVTLRHLENLLGTETFHRAMRHFFQTWRFRHPTTSDFEDAIKESSGVDLDWFFEQALHSDRTLDYAIDTATSTRHKDEAGWFWNEDGERTLAGSDKGDEKSEEVYRSRVVVERRGEFEHPVVIELRFEDGETKRVEWDGRDRWKRIDELRPSKLVSAEVDPDDLLTLDVNRINNSYRLKANRAPALKFVAHLVFWLQNVFELTSMVG